MSVLIMLCHMHVHIDLENSAVCVWRKGAELKCYESDLDGEVVMENETVASFGCVYCEYFMLES